MTRAREAVGTTALKTLEREVVGQERLRQSRRRLAQEVQAHLPPKLAARVLSELRRIPELEDAKRAGERMVETLVRDIRGILLEAQSERQRRAQDARVAKRYRDAHDPWRAEARRIWTKKPALTISAVAAIIAKGSGAGERTVRRVITPLKPGQ